MPSPFPGIDPYLEDPARWPGVHQRSITYIADALQPGLRPQYNAVIGERVIIEAPGATRAICPDVIVVKRGAREASATYEAAPTATAETVDAGPKLAQPLEFFDPIRYLICVLRAPHDYKAEVYPIPFQQPLPRFAIPLRDPDPDIALDLQAAFEKCYKKGGYEDLIDYTQEPPVEVPPDERNDL